LAYEKYIAWPNLWSHVQEIRGEEDAASETHQQAEDALAATTLAFDMIR